MMYWKWYARGARLRALKLAGLNSSLKRGERRNGRPAGAPSSSPARG